MGSWKERDLCSSSSSADASVDSITSPSDYSDDAASPETRLHYHRWINRQVGLHIKLHLSWNSFRSREGFQNISKEKISIVYISLRCEMLGDLAKAEDKKLKYCKSYSRDLDRHRSYSTKATSRTISKKASRVSSFYSMPRETVF